MREGVSTALTGFPDLYRDLPTGTLLEIFEEAPTRFSRALEGLTPEEISTRAVAGKWTIREIVGHVTDSEICGALRMRLVLAQPGGALPAYDQDRFAEGLAYGEFDEAQLADTLALFARLRSVSARLLRRASPEAWENVGAHRQWGEMTLRQLLELYADHGERHLFQILARREALGRPLEIEPRLPERLY
jgi:hypothetical protein